MSSSVIINQWIPIDGCGCEGGDSNSPVNTSLPIISGDVLVGSILSCTTGVWDGIPTTFLYQWQRDGTNISGATHATYTLVLADSLHAIRCVVSAINVFGATSASATPVNVPYPAPINVALPAISGTPKVGMTLTCSTGTWNNSPTGYTFQWLRNGTTNLGTGSTYIAVDDDATQAITCVVTATSPGGIVQATSNAVTVTHQAPINTVTPVVTGSAFAGATLTSTTGTWANFPAGYTYQWQKDGTNISGATASTYVVQAGDQSHAVRCVVTATNDGGSASANSNAITIMVSPAFPGTPVGVWSMRRAFAGYAGKCLQVTRVSDLTTLDIDFGIDGMVDIASALAFAGSSIPLMTKWYDQSGNGRDLIIPGSDGFPVLWKIGSQPAAVFVKDLRPVLQTAAAVPMTGDQTVGIVGALMDDLDCIPIGQTISSDGWSWFLNGIGGGAGVPGPKPGAMSYYTNGTPGGILTDNSKLIAKFARMSTKRASGVGTIYVNGASTLSGTAANSTTSSVATLGALDASAGYSYSGTMSEVWMYSSALSDIDRLTIDANQASFWVDPEFNVPYSGTAEVAFGSGETINCGNVLAYDRTNTWTVFCAFQMYAPYRDIGNPAAILYTNVPAAGPAFPGHELWINRNGVVVVRLMHDISAGNCIDMHGTTKLWDGNKHTVAYSKDTSSVAGGIRVYVDGVLESMNVDVDGLTATMVGAGQSLLVGMQQADPTFSLPGVISFFQIDNVVRDQTYITTHFTGGAIPPIVAGVTDLALLLNDGTGTTATDSSGNGRNGTLTSAGMWVLAP